MTSAGKGLHLTRQNHRTGLGKTVLPPACNVPNGLFLRDGRLRWPVPASPLLLARRFVSLGKAISMSVRRVGLWLVGAFGGVGGTAALGLAALGRGLIDTTALVTALPLFEGLDLDSPEQFVVGGHDIRKSSFPQAVADLHERSNVFDPN